MALSQVPAAYQNVTIGRFWYGATMAEPAEVTADPPEPGYRSDPSSSSSRWAALTTTSAAASGGGVSPEKTM